MKLVLTVAGLSLLASPPSSRLSVQQPAAQPVAYVHSGTVRSVSQQPPTVTLLTGVGLAFRLLVVHVPAEARIERGGAPLTVGDLAPGLIVRAECRLAGDTLVATRIEVLEAVR